METLVFKVADVCFSIQAANANKLKQLLPSYAPFYVKKTEEPLILQAIVDNNLVNDQPEGEELGQFDCGGCNHGIYKTTNGYKILISTVENRLASALQTNQDFSKCSISLLGEEQDHAFGLGNAMMIAFAFAASYHNILLMHASVTMQNGYGYLFLGKSGTGKSTHSSLWRKYIPGSDLLNDDNPAIRFTTDNRAIVYGTPWSGKTPCYRNLQLPIGAILRLEQYPENIIRKENKLQAFASILSSCSTMVWDQPSYSHITHTAELFATSVPTFYLQCRADEEAAQLSYQTIAHK